MVGSESENWALRVGASSVAALAACRDWACLELYAIGARLGVELQDMVAASKRDSATQAVGKPAAPESPLPSAGRQCSIIIRGLDRCTQEVELQQYETQLRDLFKQFGSVLAAKVRVRNKGDGERKTSWGLVAFSTPEDAERAAAGASSIDYSAVASSDWVVKLVDNQYAMYATSLLDVLSRHVIPYAATAGRCDALPG